MTALAWALPGLPLVAGLALLVSGRHADRPAPPVGVAVAGLTAVLAIAAAVARPDVRAPFLAGLPVRIAVDDLSALMVVTVAAVTLAVLVFAIGEFDADEARARFFGLMLLFEGAMLVTVTAASLLPLLMAWEVMGATSYALIGFWWRERWRVRAATTAFVTTRAGDLGLYLAAGAAFAGIGSLDLARLAALEAPWLHAVAAGVLLAAAGKSAQLPFSFWLSGAMAGPSSVSALLHSATMVAAGGYLLLRLSPLLHTAGWAAPVAAGLGAVTAIVLGAVACVQRDLKQVLAASTCAQVGFIMLAVGAGSVAGGAVHLTGHAVVKSLLFLAAGAWLAVLGTSDLDPLRGAGRRTPLVGGAFAVGGLALAGVPPLTLWVTKDLALHGAPAGLWLAGLVATALSAVYAGRILVLVFVRPAGTSDVPAVPASMRMALVTLALVVILPVGLDRLSPVSPLAAIVSGLAAVAALTSAWLWVRRGTPLSQRAAIAGQRWLGLDALAHRLVARPAMGLAAAMARFDDHVLAAMVDGVACGGRRLARAAEHTAERAITGAVDGIAAGGRRLGAAARRPQTGQLHQYYAQAVVGLAVLAVIIVVLTG